MCSRLINTCNEEGWIDKCRIGYREGNDGRKIYDRKMVWGFFSNTKKKLDTMDNDFNNNNCYPLCDILFLISRDKSYDS